MFKALSKYFKPKEQRETLDQTIEMVKEDENAFVIAINANGQALLRLSLQNLDLDSAEEFAKSLFVLQSGFYRIQISELLAEIGSLEGGQRLEFVKHLLKHYQIYFDLAKTNDYNKEAKPVVSPLKFSTFVNGNGEK